ncbi:PD-(D/E)XK nuclease family protein [Blattabacterium cuenoti]|uniref:PD-(D/E)XK nuclease family protein n=1 Tax=Blattabacterium cuenoti TaxID=1653831 RepID=UPI00163C6E94|nr:PD-(D/E)XK nuclease family protein [Blattabacterium cuenoti]
MKNSKKFIFLSQYNFNIKFLLKNLKFFTIKEFMEFLSGLKSINENETILYFFSILEKKDINNFKTEYIPCILNNFQNIDINLINIKNFSQYFTSEESIKNYNLCKEKINKYYFKFKSFLLKKNIAYNAMLFNISIKYLKDIDFIYKKKLNEIVFFCDKNYIFNTLEKKIVEEILFKNKVYYNNKCQLRFELKDKVFNYKYFKNLRIINVNNEIEQIKIVENIIKKSSKNKKILLILGNNNLLIPIINTFFIKKNNINISFDIDYPFKIIPINYTFISIFNLLLNKDKLKKFIKNDIIKVLSNGYIKKFFIETKFLLKIFNKKKYNIDYISFNSIKKFLVNTDIEIIFKIYTNKTYSILKGLISFIRKLKNFLMKKNSNKHFIELKFISKIEYYMQKLKILTRKKKYLFNGIKDIYNIYNQFINTENIEFKFNKCYKHYNKSLFITEFKNFYFDKFDISIITSLNNGIIPPRQKNNNLFYYDNTKTIYNDKYFILLFNKICQISKNTYAIYKSNPDEISSGEKSGFINNIIYNYKIKTKKYNFPFASNENIRNPISIIKTNLINKQLNEICINGISPSSINLYNYNPISFYLKKILKINNLESSYKTEIGKIIHYILKKLYYNNIASFLNKKKINIIKKIIDDEINNFFIKKNISFFEEKPEITKFLIKSYIIKFVELDEKLIKEGNKIFLNKLEHKFSTFLSIKKSKNIIIHGILDRVDKYNGINRIIDYKIGKFQFKEINVSNNNIQKIFEDPKYHNIMQLIFYIYLWFKYDIKNQKSPVTVAILSPNKYNIISKILINFFDKKEPYIMYKDYIKNFLPFLSERINNILDIKKSIIEKIY